MSRYVFTYNANYENGNFTPEQVRTEVIEFLNQNKASIITQCLETTFVFENATRTVDQWYKIIQEKLDGKDHVLENGFYLIAKVNYGNGYEIKNKCNNDLQNFVDETLKKV